MKSCRSEARAILILLSIPRAIRLTSISTRRASRLQWLAVGVEAGVAEAAELALAQAGRKPGVEPVSVRNLKQN
jgi:hypothetical protein